MNTARAILGVLIKGVTRTYPNIRFIFSHGGGAMPFLLARIAGFTEWRTVGSERLKVLFPEGVYVEFGKLYFECAQAYASETMDLLRRVVPPSHLLFGSDFSYFPIAHSREAFSSLQVDADTEKGIGGGNAAALFLRFTDTTS